MMYANGSLLVLSDIYIPVEEAVEFIKAHQDSGDPFLNSDAVRKYYFQWRTSRLYFISKGVAYACFNDVETNRPTAQKIG